MGQFRAGQIVIADWRDALPKEPNRLRPAIVVETDGMFASSYPNVILVPLTNDAGLAIPDLSLIIDPTPANGCPQRCYALSHCVATTSVVRLRGTSSVISNEQLQAIRRQIGQCIGLSDI